MTNLFNFFSNLTFVGLHLVISSFSSHPKFVLDNPEVFQSLQWRFESVDIDGGDIAIERFMKAKREWNVRSLPCFLLEHQFSPTPLIPPQQPLCRHIYNLPFFSSRFYLVCNIFFLFLKYRQFANSPFFPREKQIFLSFSSPRAQCWLS